ncbi:MAG TPA: cytochrome c biogenesis protein CcdA, partial [Kiloniellaceae bacterium]
LVAAFVAGAISFLSPCVLPLVPGYLSYIAGRSASEEPGGGALALRLPALGLSTCFVFGFSTVFILLGASATALGQLLLAYRYELNFIGGAIIILFGLFLIGLLKPAWFLREFRFHAAISGGRPLSAYVLGLAFAFGWTPCIGPILGAILTIGAASATVSGGVALLAIYSLGLGVPFLLAALFTDHLMARLKMFGRVGRLLQVGAGIILVLMGAAMMTGQLSALSYWLLDTFPALANIG